MLIELATLPPAIQQQILQIKADEVVQFVDNGKLIKTAQFSEPKSHVNGDFDFDLARMKLAVESGLSNPIQVPKSALTDIDAFDRWLDEVSQ